MANTKRVKIIYQPEFKGSIEGYVVRFVHSQGWRAAPSYETADLMQEAYIVFLRVCQKYPEIDCAKHTMALFKTAWARRFTDISNYSTKHRNDAMPEGAEDTMVGDLSHEGMLRTLVRQAPTEVKQVIQLLINAPTEILELAASSWKAGGRNNEFGNRMLCQLLGAEAGTDIVGMVQEHFSE